MTGFAPKGKAHRLPALGGRGFRRRPNGRRERRTRRSIRRRQRWPKSQQKNRSRVVLPTAADIERMHIEAQARLRRRLCGRTMAKAHCRTARQRIDADDQLQQALVGDRSAGRRPVAGAAVEIASQVLRQSLRVKPELLLPVVREAVTTLHPHTGNPLLFAHPDDAHADPHALGEQLAHNNWRIIEDATLSPGGCRVELGASEVDATLETRWRRVIESIGISQNG
jgi:flagellar assembly protein FliH